MHGKGSEMRESSRGRLSDSIRRNELDVDSDTESIPKLELRFFFSPNLRFLLRAIYA